MGIPKCHTHPIPICYTPYTQILQWVYLNVTHYAHTKKLPIITTESWSALSNKKAFIIYPREVSTPQKYNNYSIWQNYSEGKSKKS